MNSKLFLFLLFILFGVLPTYAASYKVKKMLQKLELEKNTGKRSLLLIDIANEVKGSNPDSAIACFFQAERLAMLVGNRKEREELFIRSYLGKASIEIARGNYSLAWRLDSLSLYKAKRIGNRELEAATYMNMGSIYYHQSEFDTAQAFNHRALQLIKTTSDRKSEGKILTNMATIEFMLGNTGRADSLFQLPLEIAEKMHDDDLFAASYVNIGLLNIYKGKYTLASEYLQKALEIYAKIDGKDGLVLCYQNLANIFMETGDLPKAIENNLLNVKLSLELGDRMGVSKGYQNLGECYAQVGDFERALNYYIQSLTIKEEINDAKEMAITYTSIGTIHHLQNDNHKALVYYRRSLEVFNKIGYTMGIASSEKHVGEILAEEGKTDSALLFLNRAALIYEKNELSNFLADVYMAIGKVYLSEKNYSFAESNFTKAERIKLELGDKPGLFQVWYFISEMYWLKAKGQSQSTQNESIELQLALKYAKQSFALADTVGNLQGKREVSGLLMGIYRSLHNDREALNFAMIKLELTDSLNKKQRAEALINAEVRWNAESKQKEINKLEYEMELQNKVIGQQSELNNWLNVIIVASFVVLILTLGAAYLFIKNKEKKKNILFQKQLREITRLKMQNINHRFSPHLFFNLLGSMATAVKDSEQMKSQIQHITSLLRSSLMNCENLAIPFKEELEMVTSYVELQRSRFHGELDFLITIPEEINQRMMIPAMILQIPVENALKHGLLPHEGEKLLAITCQKVNEKLVMKIEDNGVGRSQSQERTTGTGTGLKMLLQTIRLLNGGNKQHISLELVDRHPSGTMVLITIPEVYNFHLQD